MTYQELIHTDDILETKINIARSKHKKITFGYFSGLVRFCDLHNITNNGFFTGYSSSFFWENHRSIENYIRNNGLLILDIDEGMSIEEAQERFKEYTYLIVTTRSHQQIKNEGKKDEKKACDRFRVILLLNKPLPSDPETYTAYMSEIIETYGADPSCSDPSRGYYTNHNGDYCYNKGIKLFEWEVFEIEPIERKKQTNVIPNNYEFNELIEVLGEPVDKSGSQYFFNCPECGDNGMHPNFSYSTDTHKYNCHKNNTHTQKISKLLKERRDTNLDSISIKIQSMKSIKKVEEFLKKQPKCFFSKRRVIELPFNSIGESNMNNIKQFNSIEKACESRLKSFLNHSKIDGNYKPKEVIIDSSEPGTGKTTSVIEIAKEVDKQRLKVRVVLLSNSPKRFKGHKDLKEANFFICQGRNEDNCKNFESYKQLLNNGYSNLKEDVCDKCSFKKNCTYIKQANKRSGKHLIIHPNSYVSKPNDIVFIDEGSSLISLTEELKISLDDLKQTIEILSLPTHIQIREILIKLVTALELNLTQDIMNDDVIDILNPVFEAYKNLDIPKIRLNDALVAIDKASKKQIQAGLDKDLVNSLPANFLESLFKWLEEPKEGSIIAKHALSIHFLNSRWDINSDNSLFNVRKLIILDGTEDKNLIKVLEKQRMKVSNYAFNIRRRRTKIIQVNNSLYSKRSTTIADKEQKLISKLSGKAKNKLGIITYKNLIKDINTLIVTNNLLDKVIIGHFGYDNRVTNKFECCDILLIIGCCIPNINALRAQAKTLGLSTEDELRVIPYNETQKAIIIPCYNEFIHDQSVREITQAVYRVNRGDIDKDKKVPVVYLLTNQPIELAVTLKDLSQLISIKSKSEKKRQAKDELMYEIYNNNERNISANSLANKACVAWTTANIFLNKQRNV